MRRSSLNHEKEQDRFEQFLFDMDDVLESFIDEAAELGINLDYTLESLDRLERFYLLRRSSGTAGEEFIQKAVRYFGETVRRTYGGKWELEIDNPKHLFYGLPVIVGHAPSRVKLSPHQTFAMFTKGKGSGFLRQVVLSQLHPRDLDLKPEK